jgi:hypothetical protein
LKLPLNEFCTVLLIREDGAVIGFISCGRSKNQFSRDQYACELGFWIYEPEKTYEGMVVGVTTWGHEVEQYNGAVSLDAFCAKILECQYEFDGEKTWWYYSND